jgi:hypothetical protein
MAGVLCASTAMAAGVAMQAPPTDLPPAQALLIVRTINSAQAEVLKTQKRYVALPQLVQEQVFELPELQVVRQGAGLAPDGGPVPIGSYSLRVDPSATGKRYTLSLTSGAAGAASYFSNESGLIFEGHPLGRASK